MLAGKIWNARAPGLWNSQGTVFKHPLSCAGAPATMGPGIKLLCPHCQDTGGRLGLALPVASESRAGVQVVFSVSEMVISESTK